MANKRDQHRIYAMYRALLNIKLSRYHLVGYEWKSLYYAL